MVHLRFYSHGKNKCNWEKQQWKDPKCVAWRPFLHNRGRKRPDFVFAAFSSVFQIIFCFENLKLIFSDAYSFKGLDILILKILKKIILIEKYFYKKYHALNYQTHAILRCILWPPIVVPCTCTLLGLGIPWTNIKSWLPKRGSKAL